MSSATDGVKADVRELCVSGLGNRKRHVVVALFGVIGVAGQRVVLSQWAVNKEEDMSSERGVRLVTGASEGASKPETGTTQRQRDSYLVSRDHRDPVR